MPAPDEPDGVPLLLPVGLPVVLPEPLEAAPARAPEPPELAPLPTPEVPPLPLTGVEAIPPHAAMIAPTRIPKPATTFVMACILC